MFCTQCGATREETDRFCGACGTKLADDALDAPAAEADDAGADHEIAAATSPSSLIILTEDEKDAMLREAGKCFQIALWSGIVAAALFVLGNVWWVFDLLGFFAAFVCIVSAVACAIYMSQRRSGKAPLRLVARLQAEMEDQEATEYVETRRSFWFLWW